MNKYVAVLNAKIFASTSLTIALGFFAVGAISKEEARVAKAQEVPSAAKSESTSSEIPEIVKKVMQSNGKVLASFQVEQLGYTGWAVLPENSPTKAEIVYTSADGRYAFIGPLLEVAPNGELMNQSTRFSQQFSPKIDMAAIWSSVEKSQYIKEGASDAQAKFIVYGFMDPNCTYCHQSWQLLEPYTKAGLQIRWIPVGMLAPTSKGKSAALLESGSPGAALVAGYRDWNTKKGDAFAVSLAPRQETLDALDANGKLMLAMGARGTPAFVYKDAQGVIQKISGMIPAGEIPKVTNLPAIASRAASK